jgi:hypothetical protein
MRARDPEGLSRFYTGGGNAYGSGASETNEPEMGLTILVREDRKRESTFD